MKPSVLLVEDDEGLGRTIQERLKKEGYPLVWAKTKAQGITQFQTERPDLMIIDLRLPDGSGFLLPKELELNQNKIPFLFLTAEAGAENRLKGFELGAVEFIPKPFHLKELLLRLEKLTELLQKKNYFRIWKVGEATIDLEAFTVENAGAVHALSERETKLLRLLLENRQRVLSRDEILDSIVGDSSFPSLRTIDNSIVRLREVLGEDSIRNVRGVGYQFVASVQSFLE